MNPAIKSIYIFSSDPERVNMIKEAVSNVLRSLNRDLNIITDTIKDPVEMKTYFDQFCLGNYYIIDQSIVQTDKGKLSFLSGKECNICLFTDKFVQNTALKTIEYGYHQYFHLDDITRLESIITSLTTLRNIDHCNLIYLMIESVDLFGISRLILDHYVKTLNCSYGISIIKKNIKEIYEPSFYCFGSNIDDIPVSDIYDHIISYKDTLLTRDFIRLNEEEAGAIKIKLNLKDKDLLNGLVLINMHISELFAVIFILAKNMAFSNCDIDNLRGILHFSRAFFKNFERYELARQLTYVDDLTTVYNRRYLESYVNTLIEKNNAENKDFSIIFLDIDNLKEVNESYGHIAGSSVIRNVSETLKLSVRGFDKVFRFGGDEFAIILPFTGMKGAFLVAERIRDIIKKQPVMLDGEGIKLDMSVTMGIATYPAHGRNSTELIANSDKAMFLAKQKGKDRIEKYKQE